jgi:glycolate oxidase iron-sulfur subunit
MLGDELDGPRGRIYLMKQLFEGEQVNDQITLHLDRCLTCRACETTCPSGVEYGKLLEIGRSVIDSGNGRGVATRFYRLAVSFVVSRAHVFGPLLKLGQGVRPVLPGFIKARIPVRNSYNSQAGINHLPASVHNRKMIALGGCVQGALAPATNTAAAIVLDRLGITLSEADGAGCCGSVDLHTTSEVRAKNAARALIDTWIPCLDQGVEGFVITASGCGVTVKEYPHLFRDDPDYFAKAKEISRKTFDLSEVVEAEIDDQYKVEHANQKVAFHSPCTLQHGQQITGTVEKILKRVGYSLCTIQDAHLCCGSAGTYSIFQPEISGKLREDKLDALYQNMPDIVCTANVGCQAHLNMKSRTTVRHWIELLL